VKKAVTKTVKKRKQRRSSEEEVKKAKAIEKKVAKKLFQP